MFSMNLIIILGLIPTGFAEPSVIISNYELSPSVLMPGDDAILTITIDNDETTATQTSQSTSGGTTTTIVQTTAATIEKIWLIPAYDGDKQISASASYENVGAIGAGVSLPIVFKISADENISEGWYFPKVKIDLLSAAHEDVSYPIPVKISNSTIDLISKDIPSKISIGGSTSISLSAVNNRENSIDNAIITPVSDNFIEFTPKSIFIGTIDAASSQDISFSVIPNVTGSVNLSFIISFKNGDNIHQNSLYIPIEIIETLDVAPVIYNIPTIIGKGRIGKLRLEVYNAKNEVITGVIVTPSTLDENVRISPSQYFIGSMDPDDVFSASFDVYTSNLEIGSEYKVEFKVTFKQDGNFYETPSVNSSFKIVKSIESNTDGIPCLSGIILFIIVIIAIVLYFVFKKRRIA